MSDSNMSDSKKVGLKQRVNFSKEELELVKSLVLTHPIIEKKLHDQKTEISRKLAWQDILVAFNAEGLNVRRNIQQLKGAWKRIKHEYKSKIAAERRKKFRTGGGPPSPVAEEDREMNEMFADQAPLDNIPDDDNDYNDDDPEGEPMGSRTASPKVDFSPMLSRSSSPKVSCSTTGSTTAATSLPSTSSVQPPAFPQKKTIKKITSFAEQFHNKKMEYLKLEHELKMRVLEKERSYWALMEANADKQSTCY